MIEMPTNIFKISPDCGEFIDIMMVKNDDEGRDE